MNNPMTLLTNSNIPETPLSNIPKYTINKLTCEHVFEDKCCIKCDIDDDDIILPKE